MKSRINCSCRGGSEGQVFLMELMMTVSPWTLLTEWKAAGHRTLTLSSALLSTRLIVVRTIVIVIVAVL